MAYIPTKDADILAWGLNYSTLITADPPRYGVTAGEALVIQTEFDAFSAALTLATDPTTRSPTTVAHKDGTKALFLDDSRALAANIRANRGVTDADKAALGLTIPDPVPTPVPIPTTTCNLTILGATPSLHTIIYKDSNAALGKAKPYGVIAGLIYRGIATAPIEDFTDDNIKLLQMSTKSPFTTDIPDGVRGKIATYFTQWVTRTGKIGPVAGPFSFVCP